MLYEVITIELSVEDTAIEILEELIDGFQEHVGIKFFDDNIKAIEIAIKAIQKMISQNVQGISISYEGKVGNCPYCNMLVTNFSDKRYICACGQKLDWGEQND